MQKGFWSRIWKLKISNKMKIFCWRACSEALPTLKNLHRQKVLDSILCSAYGEHEESTLHALWNYAIVQPIWGPRFNALRSDVHEFSSFSDLVCMIGQHQELELFMVVAWFIWYRRNKNRFKEPCIPPNKIFEAPQTLLLEFQAKPSRQPPSAPPAGVKWKAPILDFYKVNYNRAIFRESNEAGIGVVVRNENREVMASLAERITMVVSVEVLEALAFRKTSFASHTKHTVEVTQVSCSFM